MTSLQRSLSIVALSAIGFGLVWAYASLGAAIGLVVWTLAHNLERHYMQKYTA